MFKIPVTLLLLLVVLLSCSQHTPLFLIVQNDRVGYIDSQGNVIIEPVFYNGSNFSEGLAAVRPNGRYGYINDRGKFVIEPVYDLANDFKNGLALVYKNGHPYFIDKSGKVALPPVYDALMYINNQKAIVTTLTNKYGVIDLVSKKLIVDTAFSEISSFSSGAAVAYEYLPPSENNKQSRMAAIDSNGKFIVPLGKYKNIGNFYDGYAVVTIDENEDNETEGVIDTKGNLLFTRPNKNNTTIGGDFHEGLAKMYLYKYWIPEEPGVISTSTKSYEGFINLKGEIILNDTTITDVNDFSNGRAFIKKDDADYMLVNRDMKQVGSATYESIYNDGTFTNGYAIVRTSEGVGIIDTTGKFIVPAKYDNVTMIGPNSDLFIQSVYNSNDNYTYSISDKNGLIATPALEGYDVAGFVNGLIRTQVQGKLTYLNKKGAVVWQQKTDTTLLKHLNIDFMNRGYFYAYSTPKHNEQDRSGGWATSGNIPQKTTTQPFPKQQLAITIDTKQTDTFARQYAGYKLFISNTTGDTVKFEAQDSRLYLKLQAKNERNEWQDIEYLPGSFCGNSYHILELEPLAYWQFTIPAYHGEFKTTIRAELTYISKLNPREEKTIYSNVIAGSINPGQFWNKRTYTPSNIMDPYNE